MKLDPPRTVSRRRSGSACGAAGDRALVLPAEAASQPPSFPFQPPVVDVSSQPLCHQPSCDARAPSGHGAPEISSQRSLRQVLAPDRSHPPGHDNTRRHVIGCCLAQPQVGKLQAQKRSSPRRHRCYRLRRQGAAFQRR
jgi:hypothetical protein